MIYATGDLHGNALRFQPQYFPEQVEMTKDDYMIVCGDFGCIQEQTQDVLQTLEQRLAAAGSDKDHMVRATIYLRDIAQFAAMNEVWDAWVNPATAPARACVEARLGREAALVEIVVDAVKA